MLPPPPSTLQILSEYTSRPVGEYEIIGGRIPLRHQKPKNIYVLLDLKK